MDNHFIKEKYKLRKKICTTIFQIKNSLACERVYN